MYRSCRPGVAAFSSVIVALSLVTVPPGATVGARLDGPVVRTTAITLTAFDVPVVQPPMRDAAATRSVASDRAKATPEFLNNLNGVVFLVVLFSVVFAGLGICLVACVPAFVAIRVITTVRDALGTAGSAPTSVAVQAKKVSASTGMGRSLRSPRTASAKPASAAAGHRKAKAATTPKRAGSVGGSGRP